MTWHGVRGHDAVAEQFRRAMARGRLASTFLFVGAPGVGKRTFAIKLAQALLCETRREEQLDPCEQCPACRQVAAGTHPDVELLARPLDKAFIPLELLIGEKERRMREGLCYNLSLKPYSGRRRIAIIDDADYLNKEGANCLLKTLEEPPPRSLLILLGTSEQRQLPTIRSRCQVVRFRPLSDSDVASLLVEQGVCDDPATAARAAAGQGSFVLAAQWVDPAFREFRDDFLTQLSQSEFNPPPLAKSIAQFVEDAGKDAPAKRGRLRQVASLAEEFYRGLLSAEATTGPAVAAAVAAAGLWWNVGGEAAAACLDICLDVQAHIDANVGQANVIDWWLDELSTIYRTGRPPAY